MDSQGPSGDIQYPNECGKGSKRTSFAPSSYNARKRSRDDSGGNDKPDDNEHRLAPKQQLKFTPTNTTTATSYKSVIQAALGRQAAGPSRPSSPPSRLFNNSTATGADYTNESMIYFDGNIAVEIAERGCTRKHGIPTTESTLRTPPEIQPTTNPVRVPMGTETFQQQQEAAQHYLVKQRFRIRRKPGAKWITAPAPNPFRRVHPPKREFGQAQDAQHVLLKILYGPNGGPVDPQLPENP